jgi:1-acyl-sn-glycerol-3-phosphate acyltransferase
MRRLASDLYRWTGMLQGWLLIALGSLLWGLIAIPPTLLLAPLWPGAKDLFHDTTRRLLRLYIQSLLFMRVEIEGTEERARGPRIVVANHQSFLDSIILLGVEPRLGGPVRRYMLRVPALGSIIRLLGFYPSDVGEVPSLDEMRASAEMARARDGALLFFPEGTRSRTGEVGPFHRGAFRTAFDHDLPIQPLVIEGLDVILPPGHLVPRTPGRGLVRVRFLEPIQPPWGTGRRRDIVRALSERTRETIVRELSEMRAER